MEARARQVWLGHPVGTGCHREQAVAGSGQISAEVEEVRSVGGRSQRAEEIPSRSHNVTRPYRRPGLVRSIPLHLPFFECDVF